MAVPVAASSNTKTGDSSSTGTITEPSGTSEGDILVAVVTKDENDAITAPTGGEWTAWDTGNRVDHYYWIGWCVRGASAPNTTWTWTGTNDYTAGLLRVTGADTTTPKDSPATINPTSVGGGSTVKCPSITTTQDDCLVLRIATGDQRLAASFGETGTEHWSIDQDTSHRSTGQALATQDQATAGSTGQATWNKNLTGTLAFTIAVAPAATGSVAPTLRRFGGRVVGAEGIGIH